MSTTTNTSNRIFCGNDNLIEWLGAKNEATGEWLNLAVCRFTLYDADGKAVSGAEEVSMSYVPDSNGDYMGTLESTVALVRDTEYTLEITLIQDEWVGLWRRQVVAVDRSY